MNGACDVTCSKGAYLYSPFTQIYSILRVGTLDYFVISSILYSKIWVAKFSFDQKCIIFTSKIGTVKIAKDWI